MANSTSNITQITAAQGSKEVTCNSLFDAYTPSSLFGRNALTTSGLTWGHFGGKIMLDGVLTTIANGTTTLTGSTTNYLEATRAGIVSKNTTAFTPGTIPLYSIVTSTTAPTSYTDYRMINVQLTKGRLALAMSDANTTLVHAQTSCEILEFTGTLTVQRNIVLPLAAKQYTVFNNTTGGYGLQFIGASGTGTVVAAGKRAIIYSDGTNVVRVTADT
jgi:hypothetical protein